VVCRIYGGTSYVPSSNGHMRAIERTESDLISKLCDLGGWGTYISKPDQGRIQQRKGK
jgi:hypothetical protein